MFMLIIFAFAGISLYFLLKPPAETEYEHATRFEPITGPELETEKRIKPIKRNLKKRYS